MAPLGVRLRGEAGHGLGRPDAVRPRGAVARHVTGDQRNEACMMSVTRVALAAVVALLAAPRPAAAQSGDGGANPFGLGATRQALEARAQRLEQATQAGQGARAAGTEREARAHAAREAADIRTRLARGDFRVGDRILVAVEGEAALSDTF